MNHLPHKTKVVFLTLILPFIFCSCEKEKKTDIVALPGLFSISDTQRVHFASGNLDESGRNFTAHQYDYGGLHEWGTGASLSGWRILTDEEWDYVLYNRSNCSSKRALGNIQGIHGLIILPDEWVLPEGCSFTPGINGWNQNPYSFDQWGKMEAAGAVFFPAAGINSTGVNEGGHYWGASPYQGGAYGFMFNDQGVYTYHYLPANTRISVRLVQDI